MTRAQRGASMIEFVLALTFVLVFVFGILESARALYTYHTVSNLARLGSRWAIVRGANCSVLDNCNADQTAVQTYVRSQAFALMNASQITALVNWPGNNATCPSGSTNARGCLVSVTVSYPFTFSVPLLSLPAITLSSSSQMIISN